jgi:hypothetical protein
LKSFAATVETDPVRSFLLAVPYPTTTTSLRFEPLPASMVTFIAPSVMATSCSVNPTAEITSVVAFAGTLREKLPSAVVLVPVLEPFIITDAPGIPLPSLLSVTLPVTVLFCENATWEIRKVIGRINDLKTFLKLICNRLWFNQCEKHQCVKVTQ